MQELNGKVAVITGEASGIGLAIAHRFGMEGMALAIADVEADPLERAADELREAGVNVLAQQTDVTIPEQLEELAAAVLHRFGRVHVVCNNAGVGPLGGVGEMSLAEFRWIIDVNFWGVLHGIKTFLPHLEGQGGHFVNTSSVSGLITQPGAAAYNVSKFGVIALSESLYYELKMTGSPIGVSVVCPATIRTAIIHSERDRPPGIEGSSGPITDRVQQVMSSLTQASHRGPDEVAQKVLHAIKENDFYVLTHPGIMPFVKHRHEDIELARNPSVEQGF